GIGVAPHLVRGREIGLQRAERGEALGERLQAGVLHRQVPKLLRTSGHFRIGEQPSDLLEPVRHLLEARAYGVFHRGWALSGRVSGLTRTTVRAGCAKTLYSESREYLTSAVPFRRRSRRRRRARAHPGRRRLLRGPGHAGTGHEGPERGDRHRGD